MPETADSNPGGGAKDPGDVAATGGDATATVTTGGLVAAPEIGGGLRWNAKTIAGVAVAGAVILWLLVKAVDDIERFVVVTLNGITLSALYFVVASGFTLIFGLMRVVNMAHGSLYLFGGYLALKMQQNWFREEEGVSLSLGASTADAEYGLLGWLIPLLLATIIIGALGVVLQQVFLRWNQGQDLRQALITIALSVIFADQMLAEF